MSSVNYLLGETILSESEEGGKEEVNEYENMEVVMVAFSVFCR
jgi:hypothetical protein